MAAPHECANCKRTTTANGWMCDGCQTAVNTAVGEVRNRLGPHATFTDLDEARIQALAGARAALGVAHA